MNRGDDMLKVVEDVFEDGKDLVRGRRLLEHARDSLKRGGPEELKRYYERVCATLGVSGCTGF